MQNALRLSELLASRLCHDIASPLNTIAGAIEEAKDPDGAHEEALDLAREATEVLTARLRLLRAAWGEEGEGMDALALTDLARGLPGRGVQLDLSALPPGLVLPPALARLVLNLLLMAAESLPRGGRVVLADAGDGALALMPDGPRMAWPAGFVAALAGQESLQATLEELSPRGVGVPMAVLVARNAGFSLGFLMAATTEAAPGLIIRPIMHG